MKTLSPTEITLLSLLGDGKCHSGKKLGELLNMSRTAIWKHIKNLTDLGVNINTYPQKGYQLPYPLKLLEVGEIQRFIPEHLQNTFDFHLFASIDSTNIYLKKCPPTPATSVCCAEIQTQGRGRFGRTWFSPFGENVYCSSRWYFNKDLSCLSGLSLVVSLALIKMLQSVSNDIFIKWPNDILWKNKKLCGSLIEINAESNGGAEVIIGVGLNVNSSTQNYPLPDKPWCSLYEITGQYFDRNIITANLLTTLHEYITRFTHEGLESFLEEWKSFDFLYEKEITLTHISGQFSGVAKGINELGQLILIDNQGTKHMLSSGDTTLRT